jgi:hypothetical protein
MKKRKQTRGKINAAKDVANEFAPNRRKHILENLELPAEKNIYEAKKLVYRLNALSGGPG